MISEEHTDQATREVQYQDEIKRLNTVVEVLEERIKYVSKKFERSKAEIVTLEERLEMGHRAFLELE